MMVTTTTTGDGTVTKTETCGLVMPISGFDDYTAAHWEDVKAILEDIILTVGFQPNLVSDALDSGVIQRRIVQNLYENPIVVCDVSGRNPNVMFEIGLRLAFDKPTILVKDSQTKFPFDLGVIEYLEYPRDLRFPLIQAFKRRLADKIKGTVEAAKDPSYTTFLKHFGNYQVAKLETTSLPQQQYWEREFDTLKTELAAIHTTVMQMGQLTQTRTAERDLANSLLKLLNKTTVVRGGYAGGGGGGFGGGGSGFGGGGIRQPQDGEPVCDDARGTTTTGNPST